MRTRPFLICGIACACLAAWYVFVEMNLFPRSVREDRPVQKLIPVEKTDILGVSVRGDTLVCLERHGSSWRITAPVGTPADQKEVNRLISSILNLAAVRSLGPGDGPDQFGLEVPGLTYTLRTMKGEHTLWIGDKTPTSYYYYAKVTGGSDVILVPAREIAGLADDLSRLRDKRLIAMNATDVNRVTLVKHGMVTQLMRDPSGAWRLFADESKKVDSERVGMFIRGICTSEAKAYLEDQAALESPDAVIEFFSPVNSEKVDIWLRDGDVLATSSLQNAHVRIDSSLWGMIPVEVGGVLSKAVVTLVGERVGKLVLSGKAERVFTKQGKGWYAEKDNMKDPSALNSFIDRLRTLEYADEYLRVPKQAGRELSIRIYYESPSPAFDITFYSQYYVTVGNKVYRISESAFEILRKSADRLFEGV